MRDEGSGLLEHPHDELLVEAREEGQARPGNDASQPVQYSDVDSDGASSTPLPD